MADPKLYGFWCSSVPYMMTGISVPTRILVIGVMIRTPWNLTM